MILGLPLYDQSKYKKFNIQPKMVNPDVVRMDIKSFRNSSKVQEQVKAARDIYSSCGEMTGP